MCHISRGAVRATGMVNHRRRCPLKRCDALTGACVLAAIGLAATSSISVFTTGPRPRHNEPQRQPDGVQRRMEEVRAAPQVVHERSKGNVNKISSKEAFNTLQASGEDVVVMLTFPWCRTCKFFKHTFKKLARIYGGTHFNEICGNENDFTKHYSREVLNVKFSPMFALYTGGKLVKTWTGGCHEAFVKNVEQGLPTAKGRMRQALVDAGYA